MSLLNSVLKAFVGDKAKKDVKELQPLVAKINQQHQTIQNLDHDALRAKTAEFKATFKEAFEADFDVKAEGTSDQKPSFGLEKLLERLLEWKPPLGQVLRLLLAIVKDSKTREK